MKTFTFCLVGILVLLCGTIQAQSILQGSVRDENNRAIPFSNVLLLNASDSSLVKGSITNDLGVFVFENLKVGKFLLAASMVGYKKNYSPIFETQKLEKNSFVLILKQESETLKEVVVVAKKPLFEQQSDKLVVNVASSVTAAGGTALEVLERSPGITINRQSNSLTMSGKSGVMVMLNGKLTRLPMQAVIQMLDGMSANNIEKIELITTPSSRYDAEGDAGIINIVSKKNLNYGMNGSFSGTLGYGWYERPAATLNLNQRTEKLNLYGDFAYTRNHNWSQLMINRNSTLPDGVINTGFTTDGYAINNNYNGKIGIDYSFTQNTTFSGIVSAFSNNQHTDYYNLSPTFKNDILNQQSISTNVVANQWKHLMFNVNMRHVFKKKQEWTIDIDRLFYRNNNPSNYDIAYTDFVKNIKEQQLFQINKKTPIQFWVLKTDWVQSLTDKGKMEFGLKLSSTGLNNEVVMERFEKDIWKADSIYTQQYKLSENIGAAYTNFNYQLSPKSSLQAGLRYEYTQTDINTLAGKSLVHRRYGNFFPSVFFTHKLSKNHSLNLSYSRRINRPSYNDLAPFVVFGDLNTFFYGNEKLLPAITDATQIGYVLKNKYVFSLKYSYDKNFIFGFIPHVDPINNHLNYYAENIDKRNTISSNVSVPIEFAKWWQSQNNLTGYWQQVETNFQGTPVNNIIKNLQINTSHTFKLPNKFTGEITYFYTSPALQGVRRVRGLSQVTIGLQKTLPENKGTLRCNVADVFWTNLPRWKSKVPSINLDETGHWIYEPRVIRFTYTRNFGNQKVKAAKKRTTGSEEERQRL